MDELLDLVDKNDNIIGTVWKSEAHGNPNLIHREVVACVFNSKGQTLIQQRAFTKKIGPGNWRITAAGHIGAGEDVKEATVREVEEELGIKINPVFHRKIFALDEKHKEAKFYYVFYAIYDGNDIKIAPKEVNDAKWVSLSEISDKEEEGKINVGDYSYNAITELYNLLKNKYEWPLIQNK